MIDFRSLNVHNLSVFALVLPVADDDMFANDESRHASLPPKAKTSAIIRNSKRFKNGKWEGTRDWRRSSWSPGRYPSANERRQMFRYRLRQADRQGFVSDVVWTLMNSAEFLLDR